MTPERFGDRLSSSIEEIVNYIKHQIPSRRKALGASIALGASYGGIDYLYNGPEAGVTAALAISGFVFGVTNSILSRERAMELAIEGKRVRAYVEALRGCFEAAISPAIITCGIAGDNLSDLQRTIICGSIGAAMGSIGFGVITFREISRALNDRAHQIT